MAIDAFDKLSDEEKAQVPQLIRNAISYVKTKGNGITLKFAAPILTDEKRQEVIKSMQDHYRKAPAAEPQIIAEGMHFLPPDAAQREGADRANAKGLVTGCWSIGRMKEELAKIANSPGLRLDWRFDRRGNEPLGSEELIVLRYACPTCGEVFSCAQEVRDFAETCKEEGEIFKRLTSFARIGLQQAREAHHLGRPACEGEMNCKAASSIGDGPQETDFQPLPASQPESWRERPGLL